MEGVYTEFYSCGKVPSSSGDMSVYSMYTKRIKGYTECGVEGMFPDFVYLVNNESWFLFYTIFIDFLPCYSFNIDKLKPDRFLS